MVQSIGRYEITGKVDSGGFGTVYRAYDPKFERTVAIKVLSSHEDATHISRFMVEAKAAGRLKHNNIVTVYDSDRDGSAPFLVMEFLDGIDLRHVIDNAVGGVRLTLLEKVEVMSETAEGLRYAHKNGVVHRDVKPANIMRLKDGSIKILDFGIARLTGTASTRLTQTGSIPGSLPYMAPELFKSAEGDILCDIWAYGVVFYELLTGVHPFHAADPAGVMHSILAEEPRLLTELIPECPSALQTVIIGLLSKERSRRTQSLDDLLLDIEPIIRELSSLEVPELVAQADRLISADDFDRAEPVIGRIRKLDPSNTEVRRLRDSLRERSHLRPQINALLRQVEEHADNREFAAALEKLDAAIRLDPGSSTLRNWAERVRGDEARAKAAEEFIDQGRRALNEGDLTGAFTYFSEASESDPANDRCSALIDEVKSAMQDRELQAHVRAVMGDANNLILIQAYGEAISLLAELAETTSNDEQVVRRLDEARQLHQAQQAKERLDAGINAARDLLKRANHEQACTILEELEREHPASPAIEVLLAHARERLRAEKLAGEIETLLAQARGQRAGGRFEQALELIQRALELDRTSGKALALQRTYLDEAQGDRDRRRIEAGLQQFQAFLERDKLDEAAELASRLVVDHPREASCVNAKREIEKRIHERDEFRKRAVRQGIVEARRLLKEGQADSATSLLGKLTTQFPAEGAVHDLLDRARQLKLSQEVQDRLNAGLNSARELLKNANFEAACGELSELDRQNPNNAAVEVLLSHARERLHGQEIAVRIENLLGEARDQREKGQLDRAAVLAQAALDLDPVHTKAMTLQKAVLDEQNAARVRDQLSAALEGIRSLRNEGCLDQALTKVDLLVAAYPRNAQAEAAKNEIAVKIRERDQLRQRGAQNGIRQAQSLLAEGRPADAAKLLGGLAIEYPEEREFHTLLDRAHQLEGDRQAREKIKLTISSARESASRREWDDALRTINNALEAQPDCREYIEEAKNIQRLKDLDRNLSLVDEHLRTGKTDQAISLAEAAVISFPGEQRASIALQAARDLRELNDRVAYARRRVAKGDLDEARQLVMDGFLRFPGSGELQAIQREIEKLRGLEQSIRDARQALDGHRFGDARGIVSALIADHPENAAARLLLEQINSEQAEHERQHAYQSGRAEVDRLIRSRQFGPATAKAQELLAAFPDDPALREDLERAYSERSQYERREAYNNGRSQSQTLSTRGDLDGAIALVEGLLRDFPLDPTLMADIEAMRAARLLREERVKIDALVSELDALFRKGDAEAVRHGATILLTKHNEPRAAELLDWAERSIKKTREIRKRGRDRNPILVVGGLAGLLVAAGIAFISLKPPRTSPPPNLDLQIRPAAIAFIYQKGGVAPKPQSLHIQPEGPMQAWTVAANQPWLLLSKSQGLGVADLGLSVDPLRIPDGGADVAIATVASASVQKTLSVHLTVQVPESHISAIPEPLLTSSPNPSSYGQPVTLRMTGSPLSGPVRFRDGSKDLGTGGIRGGTAVMVIDKLSVGLHQLTAVFPDHKSREISHTVSKTQTNTNLQPLAGEPTAGQSVVLTVAVTPSAAAGMVSIKDETATLLSTKPLFGGKAHFEMSNLPVGPHVLTAVYSGDSNYAASISSPLTFTVAPDKDSLKAEAEAEERKRRRKYANINEGDIKIQFDQSSGMFSMEENKAALGVILGHGNLLPGLEVEVIPEGCTVTRFPDWQNKWKGLAAKKEGAVSEGKLHWRVRPLKVKEP